MATLDTNKAVWNDVYDWQNAGEEWSWRWGSSYMQWYGTLLPRIRPFLPAATALEIAPGYGRWTHFLKEVCDDLTVIDISEKCIDACKQRFADCSHIRYFANDGKSLQGVEDNSIDFVFSFDSLVHAEDVVVAAYVAEISRVLSKDGVAFIHHSNLGEYGRHIQRQHKLSKFPKLLQLLKKKGWFDDVSAQWRAPSMTAAKMQGFARQNGLQCISQELVNWNTKQLLIDGMSTLTKEGSVWARDNRVLRNAAFMDEADNLAKMSRLYALVDS